MRMEQVIPQTLFESIGLDEAYFSAWERDIHPVLVEVALSADTINQLFTNIEKSATAGGDNRTLVGKAKDLPGQISDVWYNKFGAMLKQSGPIKAADAKFNDLKQKIRAANPDSKVIAAIDKYAEYAEQHPNMQKFLLAIAGSIAAALGVAAAGGVAAGALAVGTGTGVAVGIVNIADRLLKGQDLSTAVGRRGTAGLVAGLTAGAAAKVKELLANWGAVTKSQETYDMVDNNQHVYVKAADYNYVGNDVGSPGWSQRFAEVMQKASDPEYQKAAIELAGKVVTSQNVLGGAANAAANALNTIQPVLAAAAGQAAGSAQEKPKAESLVFNHRTLTNEEILEVFLTAEIRESLNEGLWDKVKTVGHNITTKVTADKLQSAWKAAGSPTDSDQLADFLRTQGVSDDIINQSYSSLKIAAPQAAKPKTTATGNQQSQPVTVDSIVKLVNTLDKKTRQQVITYLQSQLGTA